MLVHSTNSSSTPTPGSTSSATNTLEPPARSTTTTSNTSTNSSNHHHLPASQMTNSPLNSRPPSRAPSILDSPTLARVERARLRLEASSQQQHLNGSCGSSMNTLNCENSLERNAMDPKVRMPNDVMNAKIWMLCKPFEACRVAASNILCKYLFFMTKCWSEENNMFWLWRKDNDVCCKVSGSFLWLVDQYQKIMSYVFLQVINNTFHKSNPRHQYRHFVSLRYFIILFGVRL